jgi:NAD(P)-dependent dehydrogenase (short-subunit alcohol dehydrogenase family)
MKTVLITGVCGGIGKATASLFIETGWRVLGVDCQQFDNSFELVNFWQGDISQPEIWREIAASSFLHSGLDALVNNAAIQLNKPLLETTEDEWAETLGVNLTGSFLGIKFMTPHMEGRAAAVVNVSSVHAVQTSRNIAAYAVSKGGLVSLTRAAALELSEKSIRVNAVLPGAVDTEMLEEGLSRGHLSKGKLDAMKSELALKTPCGRIGSCDEVARSILFLCDDLNSSFVTGQTLVVDGGALARLSTE